MRIWMHASQVAAPILVRHITCLHVQSGAPTWARDVKHHILTHSPVISKRSWHWVSKGLHTHARSFLAW